MSQAPLLDTNIISEIMRGRNPSTRKHAHEYLAEYGQFRFSILTRYEILRGLKAKRALAQIALFEDQCRKSSVLPLTDEIVVQAAEIYGHLHRGGLLIMDADILIAATALVHNLILITENQKHFNRIPNLQTLSWRS